MSYCRPIEGDVYMYLHVGGYVECCLCALAQDSATDLEFHTFQGALEHLEKHREAGHKVPEHAFESLRLEVESGKTPREAVAGH